MPSRRESPVKLRTPRFRMPRLTPADIVHASPALVAGGLALLLLFASAHVGFNLADESYLWYGAQRALAGEIPLRDFQGYDPGRYYWVAAVMWLSGSHGFMALQLSLALFAALGIGLANQLVFRSQAGRSSWLLLMTGLSLVAWIGLRHKIFEVTLSVVSVAMLAWFLEQPTRRRTFFAGVAVGIVAIFGRNHGIYAAFADLVGLLIVALAERRTALMPSLLSWSMGVFAGYLPMLLAMVFVPGFLAAVWAGIRLILDTGTTNNSLPVPWPWLVQSAAMSGTEAVRYILTGCLLLALPLYGVAGIGYALWRVLRLKAGTSPVLMASFLLAIPYTHHAFARASLGHLAQAIYPILIGTLALMLNLPRRYAMPLSAAVCATSLFLLLPMQPLYQRWQHPRQWVEVQLGADRVSMWSGMADKVTALQRLVATYAPSGQTYMAQPYMPGAYALFDQRAPVWATYALFPAAEADQRAEVARISAARPAFVLIDESTLDGDPTLAYRSTNPAVYDYVSHRFRRVNDAAIPAAWNWSLYLPEEADPAARP